MSIENIIKKAQENDPMGLKAAFEEEMQTRIQTALEDKVADMHESVKNEEEEEDCPHCEGMGYHEDEDGNKEECPECNGTGKLKAESDDDEEEDQTDEAILTKAARRRKAEKSAARKAAKSK